MKYRFSGVWEFSVAVRFGPNATAHGRDMSLPPISAVLHATTITPIP